MNEILQVKDLEKSFGDFTAVHKINLNIKEGEIFSLLGHNGAGKSTLIKMVLGLINPTSGEIWIDGLQYRQKSKDIKRIIGYLPERMNFYASLTAWETISFYAKLKEVQPERCEEVLEQVGLGDVMHRRVGAFSKGMQQRLGLAQAVIHRPKLLILDEPTTGLDPIGIMELKQMIRDWNQEGTTIFFSSHNLADVEELAGNMAIMNKGSIVADGSLAELQQKYKLRTRIKIKVSGDLSETRFSQQQLTSRFGKFEIQDNTMIGYCNSRDKMDVLKALLDKGIEIEDFSVDEPGLDLVYQEVMRNCATS